MYRCSWRSLPAWVGVVIWVEAVTGRSSTSLKQRGQQMGGSTSFLFGPESHSWRPTAAVAAAVQYPEQRHCRLQQTLFYWTDTRQTLSVVQHPAMHSVRSLIRRTFKLSVNFYCRSAECLKDHFLKNKNNNNNKKNALKPQSIRFCFPADSWRHIWAKRLLPPTCTKTKSSHLAFNGAAVNTDWWFPIPPLGGDLGWLW